MEERFLTMAKLKEWSLEDALEKEIELVSV